MAETRINRVNNNRFISVIAESFTQFSSKKNVKHYREEKISLHSYVNKDILTFAIPISATYIVLNPDFSFTNNSERKIKLLTPKILASQISQDRLEN